MAAEHPSHLQRLLLPALLIGVAALLGWWILNSGPTTAPEEKKRAPKVVKTVTPLSGDHPVHVTAYGEVGPARQVVVEPQVPGIVLRISPKLLPGGILREGEELFVIDPVLARLDVQETEAELERAKALLAEAERRWNEGMSLAREKVIADTEIAALDSVRRIQRSEVSRIEARLERNQELLARHVVTAPFNAIVLTESLEVGQRVAPGDSTITLVGTDEFRVSAALPVSQLQWITMPSGDRPGAGVNVVMDTGAAEAVFSARVTQLQGDLETTGRMAKVLIEVKDPLRLQGAGDRLPLLLGSYVKVAIDAGTLRGVLAIDRSALRDGDTIWVAGADGLLKIRPVKVRWKANETIFIDAALERGESLIVSDLRVALPDMEIEAQPEEAASGQTVPKTEVARTES